MTNAHPMGEQIETVGAGEKTGDAHYRHPLMTPNVASLSHHASDTSP